MPSLLSVCANVLVSSLGRQTHNIGPSCRYEVLEDLQTRYRVGVVHTLRTLDLKRMAKLNTERVQVWFRWNQCRDRAMSLEEQNGIEWLLENSRSIISDCESTSDRDSPSGRSSFIISRHIRSYYYGISSLFSLIGREPDTPHPCKIEVFHNTLGITLLYYQLEDFDLFPLFPCDPDGHPLERVSSESVWALKDSVLSQSVDYADPIAVLNSFPLTSAQSGGVLEGEMNASDCFISEPSYMVTGLPSFPIDDYTDEDYMFYLEIVRNVVEHTSLKVVTSRYESFATTINQADRNCSPWANRVMVHDNSFIKHHLESRTMDELICRLKNTFDQEWGVELPWGMVIDGCNYTP